MPKLLRESLLIALVLVGLGMLDYALHAQTPPADIKPTEEVQTLKVQNLQLRAAMFQTQVQELQKQVQEAGAKLDADWAALEKDLRTALKVPADYTFDKQKGVFAPPPPPEKK